MLSDKLDDVKSLAQFFGNSVAYWRKATRKPGFPRIKMGRSIRYRRADVLAYFQAKDVAHNK